jgi:hypothetical protein
MTFDSILLKLLPFSYIDPETQEVHFDLTYPCNLLSDGDKIITFVEVLLIFLFVFYFVKLIFSWLKDRRQINILRKLLIKHRKNIQLKNPNTSLDISEEYPELLEEINNSNPRLQKLWKEFDESLIKKTDGEKFIIRNSIDAEYFFNKRTMISNLGSKLYSAIPGMLLGIGLMGTFVGLYFALIQLDVGDADKLQDSIKVLINMVGVKFAASIWGLGLSVIFTFIDKYLEFGLEKKLDQIQVSIDQMFVRETAEQNLDSILNQNTQQTKALNGLATALTEKIAAEFNTTLIPKIELMNQHFQQMPQHISSSISQTFEKPLEELSDTVKNLTANQAEKSNEALENIIREFLSELKSAAGDEGEKLKAASSQSQEILLSTSQQLQTTFTSMQTMFDEQQSIFAARDTKILEDLNQIKIDQQEMINNLSSSVKDNISTMNSEVSENISKLVERMNSTNTQQQIASENREKEITDSVNGMLSNIEKSISKQMEDDTKRNEVVTSMLQQLSSQNKELITEISSTVSGQMNSLNNNSQELFEKLISQFDNHIDRVKSSVDSILNNLKTEVQNIDVIMSSVAKQLIGLPGHLNKVSESTDKLLVFSGDLTKSTNQLLQFNSDFLKTQENLDIYSKNILSASDELKMADSHLKETLQNSQELLADMKTQFADLADKNSDTIDLFSDKVDKFMNDYHQHVEKAIKDNIIHQLDNALASYAQTMAEAITSLSAAIDELREKEVR